MRRLSVLAVCCVWAAGAALRAQDPDADRIPPSSSCLGRGGWYVLDFIEKFSNVVSEETYIQDSTVPMQSAALLGRAGCDAAQSRTQVGFPAGVHQQRAGLGAVPGCLRSRRAAGSGSRAAAGQAVSEAVGQIRWNRPIESRTKARGTTSATCAHHQQPGARHHRRSGGSQHRFRYSLGKMDPKVGPGVWIIDYQEEARPSIIRGRADLDLFAHGRVWIERKPGGS